tara:strand:+ start:712 stop:942 length:231 start_codon:yes stop_codon:yes gene_type:complete
LSRQKVTHEPGRVRRFRRGVGILGCATAALFFAWLLLGLVPGIPGMIDVFGMAGMRTPASFTIAGLLLAAIGFFEP